MSLLPPSLAARYRPATSMEVRSWSFGVVKGRNVAANDWREQRGTLKDQAIFGPIRYCECACGKYRGREYRGMICDQCGVKLTSPAVRHERFGHIELESELQHPLTGTSDLLSAFPVLPAAFVDSHAGVQLVKLYEELVEASSSRHHTRSAGLLTRLAEVILPAVELGHRWRFAEAGLLARGLALVPREEKPLVDP
jgi:hypothetical protein